MRIRSQPPNHNNPCRVNPRRSLLHNCTRRGVHRQYIPQDHAPSHPANQERERKGRQIISRRVFEKG